MDASVRTPKLDLAAAICIARGLVATRFCRHALVFAFMVNFFAVDAVVAADAWKAVRGSELRRVVADRELADGVHYAYQIHADGTLTGFNMEKEVSGRWRTTAGEFCWTWARPAAAEECFTVDRSAANFRFMRDGVEVFSGTLTPINAQASSWGATP